ncbi:DUF4352 domain-containing protein [Nocardia asteroides]|uniref:DUF4352 domain-containing protein n=1 Tax=Nocardia asteroides TaxID=1824 RepID=UPI001E2926D1|nr:DUF4352 domain-containing protein [Nocardia asteroides]UGT53759.1 DUF4352 domain-containing protein [Nocardia asteroides]
MSNPQEPPHQPYGQGQPPPYGQAPYGQPYPPQPPRKKSKVWLWVLLGILAMILLLCAGCLTVFKSGVDKAAEESTSRSTAAPVGSEVRDGKFAFVVTKVDPPVAAVGDNEYLRKEAQGEFILVYVDVTNTAAEPQTYFGSNQKLIDDQGREFANDIEAELNVNTDLSAGINPGNKVSVIIAFDVPKGTVPAAIEFHDSMFSGGTRVALR